MKILSGSILLIVIIVLTFVFISCKINLKKSYINQNIKKTEVLVNPYQDLRNMAINVTPEQLGLHLDKDDDLYGVVMDWNMGKAIVTVVTFKTGDASVYISTGQAFIGGYAHKTVTYSAKVFFKTSEKYLSKATKTELTEPTKEDKVDFYFLTKSGRYYLDANLELIKNNKSELTGLFSSANQVITEYRLITDKK